MTLIGHFHPARMAPLAGGDSRHRRHHRGPEHRRDGRPAGAGNGGIASRCSRRRCLSPLRGISAQCSYGARTFCARN